VGPDDLEGERKIALAKAARRKTARVDPRVAPLARVKKIAASAKTSVAARGSDLR
jgi:hypothetical protein